MRKLLLLCMTLICSPVYSGWQMAYTDDRGNDYAASYWVPVQINMNPADKMALVLFYGYKSIDKTSKAPIGQRIYSVSNSPDPHNGISYWTKYFSQNKIEGNGNGPYISAQNLSLAVKDAGLKAGYTFDGTNYKDSNNATVTFDVANASFFEVAVSTQ